jgi:hypothetical protein
MQWEQTGKTVTGADANYFEGQRKTANTTVEIAHEDTKMTKTYE